IEYPKSVLELSELFGIDVDTLRLSLTDLHSIMITPDSDDSEIRVSHASFSDFLKDPSRSKKFFIAKEMAHASLGHCCISLI
ncbi:hypothetical protein BDQ17DRAFT_1185281, partial [Cyathus striatus]